MFGTNTPVGKKDFRSTTKLLVASIFFTIQGEGPYAGSPAIFLRLAKCHLACSFCDTYFETGTWMTQEEIIAAIRKLLDDNVVSARMLPAGYDRPYNVILVITGGEPLLQSAALNKIYPKIIRHDYGRYSIKLVQVETTGSLPFLAGNTYPYYVVTYVASPKKTASGKWLKVNPLPTFSNVQLHLKIPVSADPESPYHEVPRIEDVYKGRPGSISGVYLTPINEYKAEPRAAKQADALSGALGLIERSTDLEVISFWEPGLLDMEANQRNHEYAGRMALQHGYKVSLQQHLYLGMA